MIQRMMQTMLFFMMSAVVAFAVVAASVPAAATAQEESDPQGVVRIAMLVYGNGKTSICFAPGFLSTVALEAGVKVHRTFDTVELASDSLFQYPFVIMTGEGAFTLSDAERHRFKEYIEQGGFLLASAGCSNAAWIDSFTTLIADLFGDGALQPLPLDHPVFHTLYDIDEVQLKKAASNPAIFGLTHKGRLRVVFSPMGLNDTANASEGCCCCGGNEVRNARFINANILTYALTH